MSVFHGSQAEEKEDEEREKRVSAAEEKKQARAVEAAVEASKVRFCSLASIFAIRTNDFSNAIV